MTYNLFIEHHTIIQAQKGKAEVGKGWEDDFTSIFSFYLLCDSKALNGFCRLILKEDYEKPISIENQVVTPFGKPDIVIRLESGSQLVVECKVDAPLQPDQLQRYLEIESDIGCRTYVTLFSKKSLNIPTAAIENDRYKSPLQRSHYFWTDLFNVIPKAGQNEIGVNKTRWFFRNYLEVIGFAPSSLNENWQRLYEDRTIDENQKVQKEFGRKLLPVRTWLTKQNFSVSAVSHSGLQAVPKSGCMQIVGIYFMVIGPEKSRKDLLPREAVEKLNNEVFRISLVYDSNEVPEHAWEIYKAFPCPLSDCHGYLWWLTKPYKFSKNRVRLEFVSNLDRFLDDETEIETKIVDSCKNVIETIFTIIEKNKSHSKYVLRTR